MATGDSPDLAMPVPAQPASLAPAGKDFPKAGGDLGNGNYSALRQITRDNVHLLGGAWHIELEGGDTTVPQECAVAAQDGILYLATTQQNVYAVNGATGAVVWKAPVGRPSATGNMRGVALGEGLVYTISGANIAYGLDQRTGAVVWQTPLLNEVTGSATQGQLAGAVVYSNGLIYVGMASDGGSRGHFYALHAATGKVAWTFWSCPAPGEYGNDTWAGDSWKTGGAACWMHPAIDPDLGVVYQTFGNPFPATNGSLRKGENLFSGCLVALDARTGERRWHFQAVHHDLWDLDNTMAPLLIDVPVGGAVRKAVVYGSKSGYFYILDRATGEPLHGIIEHPVPQDSRLYTWPTQPIPGGEPFVPHTFPSPRDSTRPVPFYQWGEHFTPPGDRPVIVYPGGVGGGDWSAGSFSPDTGYLYVGYALVSAYYTNGLKGSGIASFPLGEYYSGGLAAVDPRTNKVAWRKDSPWPLSLGNGILTTAGRVMFQGRPDGVLAAMHDETGEDLWTWQCGAGANTSPVSYEADGAQYIAIFAGGNGGLAYSNVPKGDHLWAFKVGGTVRPAAAPAPPNRRAEPPSAPITGTVAKNTVTLGRVWDSATAAPGNTEVTASPDAMAPQVMTVPAGTAVTFVNPASNSHSHGAVSFFEREFDTGVLKPGQSVTHTFTTGGEYFYNDPVFPQSTGKIIVQ